MAFVSLAERESEKALIVCARSGVATSKGAYCRRGSSAGHSYRLAGPKTDKARGMSPVGTFRTWPDVRPESAM
jgi:hypothetical protein